MSHQLTPGAARDLAHRVMGDRAPFKLLFANITTNSQRFRDFLATETAQFDALGVVEHHVPNSKLLQWRKAWPRCWSLSLAAASASARSEFGTHGGAALGIKARLCTPPIPAAGSSPAKQFAKGDDWVLRLVRFRGITIAIIPLYLTAGVGMRGINVDKARAITLLVKLISVPFIIIVDMNMDPGQLLAGPFVALQAEVVLPEGVTSTCNGGGLIDYALISPSLRAAVRLEPFLKGPWSPHIGLQLTLDRCPRLLRARYLFRPQRLDTLPDREVDDSVHPNDEWQGLFVQANHEPDSHYWSPVPDPDIAYQPYWADTDPTATIALGATLAKWSSVSEQWLLSKKVLPENAKIEQFLGRGRQARFIEKDILPEQDVTCLGFHSKAAMWWSTLATRLAE